MPKLSNHIMEVEISTQGAELTRVFSKKHHLDYLWNGNPEYWAKHSPVLFPIVGELKNHSYTYKGKTYEMGRHGFARDMPFSVSDKFEHSVTLSITNTSETEAMYPFPFRFSIQYTIDESRLYVIYKVENKGSDDMYFSIGGHPAFKVPLRENLAFEDYYLSFSQVENAERYPLSGDGLIETTPTPFFTNAEKLPLKRSLFYDDALVFKNIQSNSITLETDKDDHGLIFYFEDFSYLGIWTKKDADFICLEPWEGIADSVHATGDLTAKEGIVQLPSNQIFERQWSIELF